MSNHSRQTPRIAARNADGFFDPNESKTDSSPVPPKYVKNPETGIYERNYEASVISGRSRNEESVISGRSTRSNRERSEPSRRTNPSSRSASNREERSAKQTENFDFNLLENSLDQSIGQEGKEDSVHSTDSVRSRDRRARETTSRRARPSASSSKVSSSESSRQPSRTVSPRPSSPPSIPNSNPRRERSPRPTSPPVETRSRRRREAPEEDSSEVLDEERKELDRQRKDLERSKAAQKAADRREAEKVARERRTMQDNRTSRSQSGEFSLTSKSSANEKLLVPDYLTALMTTLRQDDTISPVPEDFTERAAYAAWRRDMRRSFQEVLIKMIKYRFLVPAGERKPSVDGPVTQLKLRVIEAKGLIGKEGRSREVSCKIEIGDIGRARAKRDKYETDVVQGLDPVWDQTLPIEVTDTSHSILLQVLDRGKEHFLGQILISMRDLIKKCSQSRDGTMKEWMDLEPKDSRSKDKYVGGSILIGARVPPDEKKPTSKSYQEIQNTVDRMQVDNRALFDVLLRACLVLDLFTPREGRSDVLSPESVSMLKAWSSTWKISSGYQVIGYLKIIFEKFTVDTISIADFLKAFHFLFGVNKTNSLSPSEMKSAVDLLERMKDHCGNRVIKYKDLFPKNKPSGVLESTILVLRMIHKFSGFKERHPELQESFSTELKIMMTEACIERFQKFKELSTPLDEGDVESVIDGINGLADLVNQDIEVDVQYFQPAFLKELDIVRLTAETQLKFFTLVLEDRSDILGGDEAVQNASHHVFELYNTLRIMAERYAKSVEGLKALSATYIEEWFTPFMYKWLDQLSKKTIVWVRQAVKADTFVPEGEAQDGVPLHSSSITDVFAAIYTELEFITDLKWTDPVQNAQFFQGFAKTVNCAVEQYCDAIAVTEKKSAGVTAVSVTNLTMNLFGNADDEPKDINEESCAKLRNIAFAMSKLREMYRLMNVAAITRNVKESRKNNTPTSQQDFVTGAFKIHVSYAENLKPALKSGSSNPYLITRVPEGTVIPPPVPPKNSKSAPDGESNEPTTPPAPIVLSGNSCELFRSRVINETLNPTWDETHSVILPPVDRLEVAIFSKNLLSADEVDGTATIDLSIGTRLRRKLTDHQTHDIYVELEPQGRVLLRMTLEGEEEDVDFWFRKTNERLIRTRDSFLRSLTSKITPYISQILSKTMKDNEAAPIPSTSYFAALVSAVEYSDKTPSGDSVKQPAREADADIALGPLIDYLEKNLATLCSQLPPLMAQAVIESIWGDVLRITINLLVPSLFGLHSQKHLSIRQSSLIKLCLMILRDFMNGDGGEFGLPFETLDNAVYLDLLELIKLYHIGIPKLRREYELSLLGGKDKEFILRLVRLLAEAEEDKNWIDIQLNKRRDLARKG